MKKTITTIGMSLFAIVMFAGCGSSGSSFPSAVISETKISFSGIAVDGYIKDATACLDLNQNGSCDIGEPTTKTNEDGSFSFSNVIIPDGGLYPVIVSGGTDTATGKAFTGELKNVVDSESISSGSSLTVSPVTDLIASQYLQSSVKTKDSLAAAKTDIATALGLEETEATSDPMKSTKIFAKVQEVQTIKALVATSITKAGGTSNDATLSKAIAKALIQDKNVSIATVLTKVEAETNVTIPVNEKTFITDQVAEVKVTLTTLATSTMSVTDLNNFQTGLEAIQDKAETKITESVPDANLIVEDVPDDVNNIVSSGETINEVFQAPPTPGLSSASNSSSNSIPTEFKTVLEETPKVSNELNVVLEDAPIQSTELKAVLEDAPIQSTELKAVLEDAPIQNNTIKPTLISVPKVTNVAQGTLSVAPQQPSSVLPVVSEETPAKQEDILNTSSETLSGPPSIPTL